MLHLFVMPDHKINESHILYSMRMREQRDCFSLVSMIEACSTVRLSIDSWQSAQNLQSLMDNEPTFSEPVS